MDNTGVVDQGSSTGEATGQATTEGSVTDKVASEGSQGQSANAGGEQSFPESGKDNGTEQRRSQFKSPQQRLYELKQQYRERETYWDKELGTIKEQLARYEQMFGRTQERKPSRTFWEAPEEVLDERISGHLSEMEKRIIENLQQTRQNDQETTSWKQETSQAAKFIREQKDLTEDDVMEITDLIREHPSMQNLRPQDRAEYALYIYSKSKGVGDKSALKAKAHVPTGTASIGKPQTLTEADIEKQATEFGDPKSWTVDTKKRYEQWEKEIRQAYRDHRVKK